MIMATRRLGVTPEKVRERIVRVTARLPAESYRLAETEDALAKEGGAVFHLSSLSRPHRTAAAKVYAGNDADDILIEVGAASRFEIPIEGTWGPLGLDSPLDELEALLYAVVSGRARERIWSTDAGIAKSEIALSIGDQEITGSTRILGMPLNNAQERVVDYEPYA